MKTARKILGAGMLAYPISMMALMAHTAWTPINGHWAFVLGWLSFIAGLLFVSPILDD